MKQLLLAAAACLIAAQTAMAADVQRRPERKDFQVAKDIARSVNGYVHFTIFDDVNATVNNGAVTLTGRVTMPYKKDDIEKRVAKINGVLSLRDDMTVLPVSRFDDQLRAQIARRIYNNSNFWNYAVMPNPPIHIVVEHGHVTLTGVVNNEVDRMLARSIAAQSGAFSVTCDLKTEAEVRAAGEKSE